MKYIVAIKDLGNSKSWDHKSYYCSNCGCVVVLKNRFVKLGPCPECHQPNEEGDAPKVCVINNGRFSWIMTVDGMAISFQGSNNADYFAGHYHALGYTVERIGNG